MKVEVLGTGCPTCKLVEMRVRQAINELGINVELIKVNDIQEIINHGVMSVPAIFINDKEMCSGCTPNVNEIKKWLSSNMN